jgi:MiaB/RimO family radical SAM methylthiotransferase
MNVSDSEIVSAILNKSGMVQVPDMENADVILANTCAIRENAEAKVWQRLELFRKLKQERMRAKSKIAPPLVGVLGCMAERLKMKLVESDKLVDMVVGPDAYRDLPRLVSTATDGQSAVNVLLSLDETYADINPVRPASNQMSAYVSIMRGCDNMCAYCIVPFTRGRERSRDPYSVVDEVRQLSDSGFKEVTLLGQNVNSYNFLDESLGRVPLADTKDAQTPGFVNISRRRTHDEAIRFTELMAMVSEVNPEMRVRFTSPHPKDFPEDLLHLIAERPNLCNQLHIPAQSGSSEVLDSMRRGYTRESYLELVDTIRSIIPNVSLSSDFISGFCGETEEQHKQTVTLIEQVQYDQAFMFAYSQREKTHAHRRLVDDVPDDVKNRRLREIQDMFYTKCAETSERFVGYVHLVLVEGRSKKREDEWVGRADNNRRIVFPHIALPAHPSTGPGAETSSVLPTKGDYVAVFVTSASSGALRGIPLERTSLSAFAANGPHRTPTQVQQLVEIGATSSPFRKFE